MQLLGDDRHQRIERRGQREVGDQRERDHRGHRRIPPGKGALAHQPGPSVTVGTVRRHRAAAGQLVNGFGAGTCACNFVGPGFVPAHVEFRQAYWASPLPKDQFSLDDLCQRDENILWANVRARVDAFDQLGIELLLQFDRAPRVEGDRDDKGVGGSVDAQVLGVDAQPVAVVCGDDLEIVVLGNVEDVDEGFVDGVADDSPSLRRDGRGDVDANERH